MKHFLESHLKEKRFTCAECQYKTNSSKQLKIHSRIHNVGRLFDCVICDFKTTSFAIFNAHVGRHRLNHPLGCKMCSYKATSKRDLESHRHVKIDPMTTKPDSDPSVTC